MMKCYRNLQKIIFYIDGSLRELSRSEFSIVINYVFGQ